MHFSISIDESKYQDEFQAVDLLVRYCLLSQYSAIKKVTDPILESLQRLRRGKVFVPAW